jgi:hypothetical protein
MSVFVICPCQFCDERIEFDAEAFEPNQSIPCPHCGLETILFIPPNAAINPPYKNFSWFKSGWKKAWSNSPEGVLMFGAILVISILACIFWFTGSQDAITNMSQEAGQGIGAIIFILIGIVLYFLPSIVAWNNKKKNFAAICVLNLLLGWTIIGWVASLVWAVTKD